MTLPVEVFGKGPNSKYLGHLKCARFSLQKSERAPSLAVIPSLRVMNALGTSPDLIGDGNYGSFQDLRMPV